MSLKSKNLLEIVVRSIIDDENSLEVREVESEKGTLLEVRVGAGDVGKVIGKKGRIASAIRAVVRASAAKNGERVMVNIFNSPIGSDSPPESKSEPKEEA
jgi:uncharacterized protein